MAIAVYVPFEGLTKDQYHEVLSKLEAAGAGAPKGRKYHCSFGDDANVQVFGVWDSQGDFDAFGESLMPILQELGVTMPEPNVQEVVNVITG